MAESDLSPRTKRLRDAVRSLVISREDEDVKVRKYDKVFREIWDEKIWVNAKLDEEAAIYILHAIAARTGKQSLEGKRVRTLLTRPALIRSYLGHARELPYAEFIELVSVCIEGGFDGDSLKEYRASLAQLLDYGTRYPNNRKELKLMLRLPETIQSGQILVATPKGQPEKKAELGILGQVIDHNYQDFTFTMWSMGKPLAPVLPDGDASYRDVWHFLMYAKKEHYGKLLDKLKANPNSNRQAVADYFGWPVGEVEANLAAA